MTLNSAFILNSMRAISAIAELVVSLVLSRGHVHLLVNRPAAVNGDHLVAAAAGLSQRFISAHLHLFFRSVLETSC